LPRDAVDPVDLFSAPIISVAEGKGGIVKHLEREGYFFKILSKRVKLQ
jgi:hypothetical protein